MYYYLLLTLLLVVRLSSLTYDQEDNQEYQQKASYEYTHHRYSRIIGLLSCLLSCRRRSYDKVGAERIDAGLIGTRGILIDCECDHLGLTGVQHNVLLCFDIVVDLQ